jgi:hypothetical protein
MATTSFPTRISIDRKIAKANKAYEAYRIYRDELFTARETTRKIMSNWDCSASDEQKNQWVRTIGDADEKADVLVRKAFGLGW